MKVTVFYTKGNETGRELRAKAELNEGAPTLAELLIGYAVVYAESTQLPYQCTPEMIWKIFNGVHSELLNPLSTEVGQAMLKDKGVSHTSMSIGDIVDIAGKVYIAKTLGFNRLAIPV